MNRSDDDWLPGAAAQGVCPFVMPVHERYSGCVSGPPALKVKLAPLSLKKIVYAMGPDMSRTRDWKIETID